MTQITVSSMQINNVSKIISISTAGIHKEFSWITTLMLKLLYKHVIRDHRLAAQIIMVSGLKYTLARPLSLTDGILTKEYRKMPFSVPKAGKNISRQDLAHFLLSVVKSRAPRNETVGLA